jgi:hypothetical protein
MQDSKAMWGLIVVTGILALAVIIGAYWVAEPGWSNLEAQKLFFEVRRLFFAAGVLAMLGFLLILGVAVYVWGPPAQGGGEAPGKFVFDSMIKIIPPIITLVLGFYFGQATGSRPAQEPQRQETPAPPPSPGAGSSSKSGSTKDTVKPAAEQSEKGRSEKQQAEKQQGEKLQTDKTQTGK